MISLLTVEEVATQLRVRPRTVYELCNARTLPHHRVGQGRGMIRITQPDLDHYFQQGRVEPKRFRELLPPLVPRESRGRSRRANT
jgi:excisionase family DNA binding protein